MDRYIPPYEITDAMTTLISDISEEVGRIDASGRFSAMPHLRRNTRIRSIHASLRIEANSLTADQVRDVINGETVIGPASEILEVKNAYKAYSQIGRIDPYQISELKRLHGIMTKDLIAESGTYTDMGRRACFVVSSAFLWRRLPGWCRLLWRICLAGWETIAAVCTP